jgi:hypothetical protein
LDFFGDLTGFLAAKAFATWLNRSAKPNGWIKVEDDGALSPASYKTAWHL